MNQLPESANNTLHYELYLSKEPNNELVEKYKEQVKRIIGHEGLEDFHIKIHKKHKNLCYGNIKFDLKSELEWLTIYALFELSKFDQDLVVRVYDNDGDVILIEAGDHLPAWLESSKSENRVFIHDAKVHILPECIDLKKMKNKPEAASEIIRGQQVDTLASQEIQAAIEKQLSGLPNLEAWLAKKFKLLNEIVSGERLKDDQDERKQLNFKPKEKLTLDSIRAMNNESLRTSPLSSPASSSNYEEDSSNDWSTEEEEEVEKNNH